MIDSRRSFLATAGSLPILVTPSIMASRAQAAGAIPRQYLATYWELEQRLTAAEIRQKPGDEWPTMEISMTGPLVHPHHPQGRRQADTTGVNPHQRNAAKKVVLASIIGLFGVSAGLLAVSPSRAADRMARLERLQADPARFCKRPLTDLSRLPIARERGFTVGLGRSMLPTMKVGALALIWRHPRGFRLRRGMIVYFRRPGGERWMKRVIGLPGDRIQYRQSGVTLTFRLNGQNVSRSQKPRDVTIGWIRRDARGKRLTGPDGAPLRRLEAYREYIETLPNGRSYRILHRPTGSRRNFDRQLTVPAGHLFVLGDNRQHSFDSRFSQFGFVPLPAVLGIALCDVTRKELMEN